MEKFYMQDSNMQDNNEKKKQRGLFNVSIVLSFAVAIFAIFSIAMAGLSMSQNSGVSYAAPVVNDTFTLKMGKKIFAYDNPQNMTKAYIMETYYYDQVNANNAVYCIERNKDVDNGDVYKKIDTAREGATDVKKDLGLLFLLNKGTNKKSLTEITEYEDDVDVWVVQSAIWYYLNEKYGSATDATNVYNLIVGDGVNSYLNDKAIIESNNDIYLSLVDDVNSTAPGTFKAYKGLTGNSGKIMELVNTAKEYKGEASTITVTKAGKEFSKTTDGKYYQSTIITVTGNPSSKFDRYNLKLTGIEGAIAVDENGETLALTNIPAGTKFYVRIPVDKVSTEIKKLKIDVTGYFNDVTTYYYVESKNTNQRMASLSPVEIPGETELEIVGTDDTGMSAVQTIYFIGLIVLLCGVGIVYANAKPVQVKQ